MLCRSVRVPAVGRLPRAASTGLLGGLALPKAPAGKPRGRTGPTHEISHSGRRSSTGLSSYRKRGLQAQSANLEYMRLARITVPFSLTAPRALIALISCVGPGLLSLEERIDTSSAAGELVFHVF